METLKKKVIKKTKEPEAVNFLDKVKIFLQKVADIKVNFWKMMFFVILAVSLFYNVKQKRIIDFYESEYEYFDSISNVHTKEMDSLKTIISGVQSKEIVFDLITNNISREYELLYEHPKQFADLYLNSEQESKGGGE